MKYASLMTTGLLVNISIFASDMPDTTAYADLMGHKQRIIKQLSKQAECVRLAEDDQSLRACQAIAYAQPAPVADQANRSTAKLKTDDSRQHEFF